jgi:glycerophosphoryl diester phosphodiesterase
VNGAAAILAAIMASHSSIELQGHRGARGHLPENTLPGFEAALAMGVDTLELDVGVTRDGVVVVHHDRRLNPDLARGPDGSWVRAPAPTLHSLSFPELQTYDVGRLRPGSEYAQRFPHQKPLDGARIPRLSEVLGMPKVKFNIETKISPQAPDETLPPEPFARALIAEIRGAGVAARATIQSFDFRTLEIVQREAPEIRTAYLTHKQKGEQVPRGIRAMGGAIWSPHFEDLDGRSLAVARELGVRVVVWTVNEPADIRRMLSLGVDGIISDYPDRVRR